MGRMFDHRLTLRAPKLPAFVIAYQPIIDATHQRIVAYEALTRSPSGLSYPQLIAGMDLATLHAFHRATAAQAVRRAAELGIAALNASLSINLQPDLADEALNADYLLGVALECGLSPGTILLELTEDHKLTLPHLRQLLARNHAAGFCTAVDDFGAGYSGLTMLVDCRPELLKLDRGLIRGIDHSDPRQRIVAAFVNICESMQITLVAEGVETEAECAMLRHLGIDYMQGYLFSHPVVDQLPQLSNLSPLPLADPATRKPGIPAMARWLCGPRHSEGYADLGSTLPA